MKLFHTFIKKYPEEIQVLLNDVTSWKEFNKNLHTMASNLDGFAEYKTVLGDGFELFVEGFIKLTETDERYGIHDYDPVPIEMDYGIDGMGMNIIGEKSAVQIKYKTDPTTYLTTNESHLSNMVVQGLHEGIDSYGDIIPRYYIFTSCRGLHRNTDVNVFRGKIKCYGISDIRQRVDNNVPFWNQLRNLIKNS